MNKLNSNVPSHNRNAGSKELIAPIFSCQFQNRLSFHLFHLIITKGQNKNLPQIIEKKIFRHYNEPHNEDIRISIAEWIIVDNLPINVVKGKGFQKMMTTLDPGFPIPTNKAIKKKIHKLYVKYL